MKPRLFISLGLSISLSACVSLLPDPQPASTVYRLATPFQAVEKSVGAEVVRVDRPLANQIFNSENIVVSMDGQKLSAIAKANWAELTPVMLQGSMIDALAGSSQFIGLVPTSGARTQTRLHLAIKNFEASFDNGSEAPPLAIVHYNVTYARSDDRKLLGTHSVRKVQRASSINVSSIVTAIEQANNAAMTDIVTWLEKTKRTGRS